MLSPGFKRAEFDDDCDSDSSWCRESLTWRERLPTPTSTAPRASMVAALLTAAFTGSARPRPDRSGRG